MFNCRGGKSPQSFEVPQPQLQMQPTMVQPGMNPMDIMNFAMQQFQMMCQQSGNNPLLTIYRQPQPAGRPMRSVQNMRDMAGGSPHMPPPPPPPPIAGAPSHHAPGSCTDLWRFTGYKSAFSGGPTKRLTVHKRHGVLPRRRPT